MHLLVISGMLGSGKTTFILNLAKSAVETGCTVAILVNEIGEIGIDNQYMRQLDLDVYELIGGCICCTLSADLVKTLEQLEANYQPDIVLLEPSGAADLRSLTDGLQYYHSKSLQSLRYLAILDPLRNRMFMEVITPLVTSLIKSADTVLISKIDLASDEQLRETLSVASKLNPHAKQFQLSAKQSLDMQLIGELLP
jgi:G3E family GTPase